MKLEQHMTPKDVSDAYSISMDSVRRAIRSGALKAVKIGSVYRIAVSEAIKWATPTTEEETT